MPNYTADDILNNPLNIHRLGGYVGKILRINLTEQKTEIISNYEYVPKYLGGRAPVSYTHLTLPTTPYV